MRILVDTHALLWLAFEPNKVPGSWQRYIDDLDNEFFLSVAAVWELIIKVQAGKLRLEAPIADVIERQRVSLGLQILPVQLEHVMTIAQLPPIHKDPFDRLMIAQAIAEQLAIATVDPVFASYAVPQIR